MPPIELGLGPGQLCQVRLVDTSSVQSCPCDAATRNQGMVSTCSSRSAVPPRQWSRSRWGRWSMSAFPFVPLFMAIDW